MRRDSARITGYAALTAIGLLTALATRHPELVVAAAPFAVLLAAGLHASRAPDYRAWLDVGVERTLQRDEIPVTLHLRAIDPVEQLEAVVVLPAGLEVAEGSNPSAIRLTRGEERAVELMVRCNAWGSYTLGDVRLRARGKLGLHAWEQRLSSGIPLRVYPAPEMLRGLVRPLETQLASGNEVARHKGDGLEFADLRPFVAGDRLRSVNWRATARRGHLIVNEHHPERNTDVIVFLDSFADVRRADEGTLDRGVRAAATLAALYLERRDRVGLVTFGGVLRWLEPGTGLAMRYRLVDAILETGVEFSWAWKDVNVIPSRVLPPNALVLAVTPLLDERAVTTLLDLRARGYDLAVIEVSPTPFVPPGENESDALAHRLWLLRRDELRSRFERLGVAVGRWDDESPLAAAVEGVSAFRRHAPLARR